MVGKQLDCLRVAGVLAPGESEELGLEIWLVLLCALCLQLAPGQRLAEAAQAELLWLAARGFGLAWLPLP